ncbi:MAG TPA: TIGR02391 family protein [Caulobacteraceae bacterium]
MTTLLERIRNLQEHILEVGLARSVLALPAPRMLALSAPNSEASGLSSAYGRTVTESEINDVSRDLFASGHYSLAVQEALKAVEKFVQEKVNNTGLSGTKLMEVVFSPDAPRLFWSNRKTASEVDEQRGYQRLYAGAMLGIRNPVTHEFNWIDDGEVALELVLFAQHLLRKAKAAITAAPTP